MSWNTQPRRRDRLPNESAFQEAAEALFDLVEHYLEYDTCHREELEERVRVEEDLPRSKGGTK